MSALLTLVLVTAYSKTLHFESSLARVSMQEKQLEIMRVSRSVDQQRLLLKPDSHTEILNSMSLLQCSCK